MTTGLEIYNFLKNGIDQEYSDFLNIPRANRLLREAEVRVSEKHYSTNRTQKQSDELSPLTVLDSTIPIRDSVFGVGPMVITGVTVVGTTATLTFGSQFGFSVGDSITVSGVEGFVPGIDGTYLVQSVVSTISITITVVAQTGTWTQGTGEVIHEWMYSDMVHPLAIRTTFVGLDTDAISSVSVGAVSHIIFDSPNYVREGSKIRITGGLGVVGLNGEHYCKRRNRKSYRLYQDEELTIPSVLTGVYQGGAVAALIVKEQATRIMPDHKISESAKEADRWSPRFATGGKTITVYPKAKGCESVEVDYIRTPPVTMDVQNDDLDLELYYNFKYLMRVKDEAVNIFLLQMRELQTAQAEITTTQMNP